MPKPFDATAKQLIETRPADWPAFFGLPADRTEVIDADLAAVTADADRVLRVEVDLDQDASPAAYLLHIEFQASYDAGMPLRLLRYNALLRYRHGLPVYSVVVLLRREADGPALTGVLEDRLPAIRDDRDAPPASADPSLRFGYGVVRVFALSVADILRAGVATLPLAPIADVSASELPGVVRAMQNRLDAEVPKSAGDILWASTYLLLGLRYPEHFARQLLKGVRQMRESSTYQAILAEGRDEGRTEGRTEGRAEEARALILRLGAKRFGAPDDAIRAALEATGAVAQLEELAERLLEAESWEELLR